MFTGIIVWFLCIIKARIDGSHHNVSFVGLSVPHLKVAMHTTSWVSNFLNFTISIHQSQGKREGF